MDGMRQAIRHGVGARRAFGRMRVRTVTWIGLDAQVEGVEADDYPVSRSLLSRLRRAGRALARTPEEVPAGYEPFTNGWAGSARPCWPPTRPRSASRCSSRRRCTGSSR
jgi:hypothetical protein